MRVIIGGACLLIALLVWYLVIGKGLPYSTYTREYKSKDPIQDASKAWDSGDRRFKGIYGVGLDAPGVPCEWYYVSRNGMDGIRGTSDCRTCSEQGEFQHVAYEYAKRYNAEVLLRLGASPSEKAAATGALLRKQGGDFAVLNGEIAAVTMALRALKDAPTLKAIRDLGDIELLRVNADIPAKDADLDLLTELTNLTSLNLSETNITDAGLDRVVTLRRLEFLQLNNTKISDAGLAKLKSLGRLKSLYLPGTNVTDAGMSELQSLQTIALLYLGNTMVTDQGLMPVGKLGNLTDLILGSATTDRGLAHLTGLKRLKFLGTQFTTVTPAGLAALKKSLPHLDVP
jgi:Leucine-rich repeat (LRR) protein